MLSSSRRNTRALNVDLRSYELLFCLGILWGQTVARACVQGRNEEAELLYKRSLEIDENFYGPDHPDVAADLFNWAEFMRDQVRGRPVSHVTSRRRSVTVFRA